jgi:hypothetical protein
MKLLKMKKVKNNVELASVFTHEEKLSVMTANEKHFDGFTTI